MEHQLLQKKKQGEDSNNLWYSHPSVLILFHLRTVLWINAPLKALNILNPPPHNVITGESAMNVHQFLESVEQRFCSVLEHMKREEVVLAEKNEERLVISLYSSHGDKTFPLKKVAFMLLENGWVWNKDDRKLLDEDELIVGSFIPSDGLPLPILALEASLHFGKYDHLNIDLFPLSRDKRYRELFCEPVKKLRKKHEDLPGLLPGVRTPSLLGEYTSQGMLAGDFPDSLRATTIPWWFDYVDLYRDFLGNRDRYSVLKEPSIIEEGKNIKEVFLARYRQETPRILSDIPHLYSEENGARLGTLLF